MGPLRSLLAAVQFLTRVPVPAVELSAREAGGSLVWYPVVGAAIGAVLFALSLIPAPPLALAGLMLLAWVTLTGALHLDGLADTADAWVGGHGDAGRTLAIMKDPYAGPMGVAAVVAVLVAKFAGLAAVLQVGPAWGLVLVPALGRAVVPGVLFSTPYVRRGGLGQALADHFPGAGVLAVLTALAAVVLMLLGWVGLAVLAAVKLVGAAMRLAFQRRLGGVTGDCLGAMIELGELAALYALVIVASMVH